jgi:hypothetical protein
MCDQQWGFIVGTMVIHDDTLDMTRQNGHSANHFLGINDEHTILGGK